jgi:hypothetical protein
LNDVKLQTRATVDSGGLLDFFKMCHRFSLPDRPQGDERRQNLAVRPSFPLSQL